MVVCSTRGKQYLNNTQLNKRGSHNSLATAHLIFAAQKENSKGDYHNQLELGCQAGGDMSLSTR
jgi:hypothetical protein